MSRITVEQAIDDIREGKIVILVDDEDRENEGDLTMAAEKVTPEAINFMAKYGRGLICLSMEAAMCDRLELPMMVKNNTSPFQTGFTISIEAAKGVTTGISAADRATTILTAVADDAEASDLVRPGHIFPLRARNGGVMIRVGQTEGSVDLARLAGLKPAGVICEVMDEDGTMARMPSLQEFSDKHGLGIVTIADLVEYRMRNELFVHRAAETTIPTEFGGDFNIIAFENDVDELTHIALVKGDIDPEKPTLVRVHSECMTGDIFGSLRCDCGDQLHKANGHDPGGGLRCYHLPASGGPRHRSGKQAEGLRTATKTRARYGRGQSRTRIQRRFARLWHRRPNAAEHRCS